ncbi:MAG: class I SAM-dependent methyltransferase [Chlamydiales bacterium]|nr:class I SAM-dependent methyltransferase [Chlamydiales bacterium]
MRFFSFFLLTMVSISCINLHAESSHIPPQDIRTDRAKYVSSLIRPGDVGAEIGVWQGVFAYHTLLQRQPSQLYLIDPWIGGTESDPDRGHLASEAQRARDQMCENVQQIFAPYPNVRIMRMKSEEAVSSFPDQFFDYVYIDGDHSYDGVMRDLVNYLPKVKVGGLLIGDDYGWGQVSVAVQDFLRAHKNELLWGGDPCKKGREGQFFIKRVR